LLQANYYKEETSLENRAHFYYVNSSSHIKMFIIEQITFSSININREYIFTKEEEEEI
jgi:hypothetical protein